MADDFMKPSWMLPHDLAKQCESSALLQLMSLLKTFLKLIEDVDVVWCLHFDENFKDSEGVCVSIVVNHAINNPTLFR